MDGLTIRTAETGDMERLLEIYNYEVENGVATFDLHPRTMEERMEWFRAHNVDNHPLIVAEVNGRAAGYASLSQYREKEAYAATVELSVYVAPECRRQGIAHALMRAILDEAKRRDDIHTVISVITEGNDASIRLHEEFGFAFCGTMREVGEKFGRKLGIVNMQLMT